MTIKGILHSGISFYSITLHTVNVTGFDRVLMYYKNCYIIENNFEELRINGSQRYIPFRNFILQYYDYT